MCHSARTVVHPIYLCPGTIHTKPLCAPAPRTIVCSGTPYHTKPLCAPAPHSIPYHTIPKCAPAPHTIPCQSVFRHPIPFHSIVCSGTPTPYHTIPECSGTPIPYHPYHSAYSMVRNITLKSNLLTCWEIMKVRCKRNHIQLWIC